MRATGKLFKTLVNVGYPMALLVLVTKNTSKIKNFYGRSMNIKELLRAIEELKPIDVRLKMSFDPIHFNNPASWSYWGYPLKTLVEELRLDRLTNIKFEFLSPKEYRYYASYFGLAVVSPTGKLYGFLIMEPLHPRKIVVLLPSNHEIHAYTGDKEIASILLKLGYTHVVDGEYIIRTNNVLSVLEKTLRAIKKANLLYRVFMPREYRRKLAYEY